MLSRPRAITARPMPRRLGPQCKHRGNGGEQRDRDQQVGVGLAGVLRIRGRWSGGRQTRVGGLADLDAAVGDELGDDEADRRGDHDGADRPLRREHGAGSGCRSGRYGADSKQDALAPREGAQDQHGERAQQLAQRPRQAQHECPQPAEQAYGDGPQPGQPARQYRLQLLDAPRHRTVDLLRALPRRQEDRADAPSCRCYHRASLRLSFRSPFRRAREGLFHAPIPALARSVAFVPSPFHDQTLTLGTTWHAAFP